MDVSSFAEREISLTEGSFFLVLLLLVFTFCVSYLYLASHVRYQDLEDERDVSVAPRVTGTCTIQCCLSPVVCCY